MATKHHLAVTVLSVAMVVVSAMIPSSAFADTDLGDTPSYSATTLDGATVTAEQLRGKVVLVDFWATWCGPCKDSLPVYSQLADTYDGKLVVLAVSVDGKRELVREFLDGSGLLEGGQPSLTVVWHKDHPLARTFGPSMFPTSYLIDTEGVVRHIHTGFDKEVREKTAAQIKALVEQ
jgi:thiol-disulfide isomerase/thioredoxin